MNYHASLAGNNFRPVEAQAIYNTLTEGYALALEREPNNQYDPNAIKVIDPSTEIFIGYVEKSVAFRVSPLLIEGTATVEVYEVVPPFQRDKRRVILEITVG